MKNFFYALYQKQKGFTLIELSVVVVIIAVLAALAVPAYQKAAERSKTMEAVTILNKIRSEQEKTASFNNGKYADTFSSLSPVIQGKKATGTSVEGVNYTFNLKKAGGVDYAEAVPKSKYDYTIRTGKYSSSAMCAEGKDAGIVKSLFKGCDDTCDDVSKALCTSSGGTWSDADCACTCPQGTHLDTSKCVADEKECDKGSKPEETCGNCGTQSVSCNKTTGMWETSPCTGEGECEAGKNDIVENGYRTCSASCSWNSIVCNAGYSLSAGVCVKNTGNEEEDDDENDACKDPAKAETCECKEYRLANICKCASTIEDAVLIDLDVSSAQEAIDAFGQAFYEEALAAQKCGCPQFFDGNACCSGTWVADTKQCCLGSYDKSTKKCTSSVYQWQPVAGRELEFNWCLNPGETSCKDTYSKTGLTTPLCNYTSIYCSQEQEGQLCADIYTTALGEYKGCSMSCAAAILSCNKTVSGEAEMVDYADWLSGN
ncbi:prepilin-type N-terminal cleavage/methylation domain-containing protein [Parelusimicrobium proximum]|uniref:type IV pilin protein n=1 Tax=Parelusimicrobium proximum TaxID=3228953 RepID=UPI003D176D90